MIERGGAFARLAAAGLVVAIMSGAGPAMAQTVQAGPLELDFTGRAQIQLNTTSVDEEALGITPPGAVFEMRRVRLGTNFSYEDWVTGKLEAELTDARGRLTDAYIDVALSEALVLRAGQFKQPFGLIELESNTRILTIERTMRIRGVEELVALAGSVPGEAHLLLDDGGFLGRQIGVMAHGRVSGIGYSAGVFNGEGANVDEERGSKSYSGRLDFAPLDRLVVGAAVSVQPTAVFDGDDEVRATAWGVDAEWGGFRSPGLRVMVETMIGENPLLLAEPETLDPADMAGAQVAAGWFVPREGRVEGIEPVARLSWADPDLDADDDSGLLVTPGVNVYFTGRNRLMLNGDVYFPGQESLDPELALLMQLQIYF